MLAQCWDGVSNADQALSQCWIASYISRLNECSMRNLSPWSRFISHLPRQLITPCHEHQHRDAANTRHSADVVSMLCHRLRRWPNIDPTFAQSLVFAGDRLFVVIRCSHISAALFNPANTILWNNAVLMLGQRRRRWANIKKSLFQSVVFAGKTGRFAEMHHLQTGGF